MGASMNTETASLQEKRREKRIREILSAALDVFTEKGYPKTTMDDIAERALLTRPALYKYFRDKQSILKALVEWKMEELIAEFEAIAGDGTRGFEPQLRRLVRSAIAFQKQNRGAFHALLTANSLPSLTKDERFVALKNRLVGVVAGILQKGIDAGEVRPEPAHDLAELFLSLLFHPAAKGFVEPDNEDAYDGRLIEEVFLYGVAAR